MRCSPRLMLCLSCTTLTFGFFFVSRVTGLAPKGFSSVSSLFCRLGYQRILPPHVMLFWVERPAYCVWIISYPLPPGSIKMTLPVMAFLHNLKYESVLCCWLNTRNRFVELNTSRPLLRPLPATASRQHSPSNSQSLLLWSLASPHRPPVPVCLIAVTVDVGLLFLTSLTRNLNIHRPPTVPRQIQARV